MRIAASGRKNHASAAATCASICRRGVTSSKIQNDRPNVAITRSLSWTTRSRTEVTGKFSCKDCQSSPSLKETYTPFSVQAYSNPFRTGSSRTQFRKLPSGIPLETRCQLFPKSRDRKSTRLNSSHLVISYAVFCLKKNQNFQPDRMPRAQRFH